jgi:hypothetical protein
MTANRDAEFLGRFAAVYIPLNVSSARYRPPQVSV